MNKPLKDLFKEAEAVVVGAGAGLSTAAGFLYGGEKFLRYFPEMHLKYGYTDMYSAGFHDFRSEEEKWGYWSEFIYLNRYKEGAKPLYRTLVNLLKKKDYFVITTNVDHQFQLAGIDKTRLYYTQGDYGLFQCSRACHNKTYDNESEVLAMVAARENGRIPSELVPHCPVCGAVMETNLRKDGLFVQDEGWYAAEKRYEEFLSRVRGKRVLFWELGVGFNTPGIIKYPFMRMTHSFERAFYCVVNRGENYLPKEIAEKSLVMDRDLSMVIQELAEDEG